MDQGVSDRGAVASVIRAWVAVEWPAVRVTHRVVIGEPRAIRGETRGVGVANRRLGVAMPVAGGGLPGTGDAARAFFGGPTYLSVFRRRKSRVTYAAMYQKSAKVTRV